MSYGIGERSVLIALMAINKSVTNKELKERYGTLAGRRRAPPLEQGRPCYKPSTKGQR